MDTKKKRLRNTDLRYIIKWVCFSLRYLPFSWPGVANPQPAGLIRHSSDFCLASHLTLDWHCITLQLTYSAMNLWNRYFSLNPLLTSTRTIYGRAENIKTSWLIQNWWYNFLEVRMFVNNSFRKWNILKVIKEQGCVTTTWIKFCSYHRQIFHLI